MRVEEGLLVLGVGVEGLVLGAVEVLNCGVEGLAGEEALVVFEQEAGHLQLHDRVVTCLNTLLPSRVKLGVSSNCICGNAENI